MTILSLESIDDYLGERATRFFGQGYKNTDLNIRDVLANLSQRTLNAKLDIDLIGGWSSHGDKERTYHLSNIEALVVAGQVSQCLLYAAEGLKREQVENLWIRGLEIRNISSIEQITGIPVKARVIELNTMRKQEEVWKVASLEIDIGNGALRIVNYRVCFKLKNLVAA